MMVRVLVHTDHAGIRSVVGPPSRASLRSLTRTQLVPLLLIGYSVSLTIIANEIDLVPASSVDMVTGEREVSISVIKHSSLSARSGFDLVPRHPRSELRCCIRGTGEGVYDHGS